MADDRVAFGEADLTNCDREQIHIPGSIQPHGALLVLEPGSLGIVQAGGDIRGILGVTAPELLGKSATSIFLADQTAALLAAVRQSEKLLSRPQHLFRFPCHSGERSADAIIHASGLLLILELEPAIEEDPEDALTLVQAMMRRIQQTDSLDQLYQSVVDEVRAASDFDRVMLYRFLSDDSGSVEAESRLSELEPYLGLRYPASDIPRQARALYLRNWIRVISDARYTPSPLYALSGVSGLPPVDLSMSGLRSVSPIHLEYLANMGVVASMSLSLIVDGKLWGLIACHHYVPRYPSYRSRVALELFAQMASFHLETKIEAADLGSRLQQKTISEALINSLAGDAELALGLKRFRPALLDYIHADGIALWLDGQFSGLGKTPRSKDVGLLVRWLNENVSDGVFSTDKLSSFYPPGAAFADKASGILALSVSRTPRDYVIWFRPEVVRTISWAGNPEKTREPNPERAAISPRKSFAAWKQEVRLRSDPWTNLDTKTALALRLSLLEVVLQHTDQLARERERARVQQQALLLELDNKIIQWETTASQLKLESDRRAVVETELSQLLRRTVLDQEAERQRISRELHDSLGQYLTVMRMDLEGIGREAAASESIRRRVEKLKLLTSDVGQEVNQLAWEIRPTALDDLGLQKAFEQFIEEWAERSTLKFDVHLVLNERRLPAPMETALYRVLQEAIRNVVKHADAKHVGVILEATQAEVRLIIEDDGKGFVWSGVRADGASDRLGLLGIRERLALVGGTLEVESTLGSGTTLLIHVPL